MTTKHAGVTDSEALDRRKLWIRAEVERHELEARHEAEVEARAVNASVSTIDE